MSYSLKAFMQLSASLINTPNTVAEFGELSNISLTYSRNQKTYVNSNPSTMVLRAFYTKSSDNIVEIPGVIKNKVFEVTQWIMDTQFGTNAYNTKNAFLSALTNQFGTQLSGLNCGDMISNTEGQFFPTWIGFTQLNIANTEFYSSNLIKIWYADESFRTEYDENEIIVIPPVSDLEGLFSSKATVQNNLTNFRNNELINKINTVITVNPSTEVRDEVYLWKEQTNPLNTLNTIWTVIIYGRLDGNSDYIKDAVRSYIAANSSRTETAWRALIPDIYLNTEFYIFPKWANMAIAERDIQVGQYSPMILLTKELAYIKSFLTIIPESHVNTYLTSIPFQYKSLNALVISGNENRDNIFSIKTLFPDFLNVPTTDSLFNLQSVKTKEWVIQMGHVLETAEKTGIFDPVPTGMSKILRNNILYITFKYDNIEYLVSTKSSTPNYPN